jgi:ubiquinone/menaquinone biosynthesis C-methylase UbiE
MLWRAMALKIFLENRMTNKAFSQDVNEFGGYAYTTQALSGRMSNARISKSILAMDILTGKKIIDIGCGDGTYSYELAQQKPALVVAIDPVENAVKAASKKYKEVKNLRFECVDLYQMEIPQKPYDIAVLRGVLHHLHDLEKGIEIACKLAKKILVIEPNGYNPVLKIIEKTSRYHIKHGEQSFTPARLRWIFKKYGGAVVFDEFVGLVPFFCPDKAANFLKFFEKTVESIPLLRAIACGQYVFLVEIKNEA